MTDRPRPIETREELERALGAGTFVLFKHSFVCPVSARAFRQYSAWAEEHPDVATGWIDVIDQRPWSQGVAARTGVAHESPQVLLFRDGAVVWNTSHGGITHESLADALREHVG